MQEQHDFDQLSRPYSTSLWSNSAQRDTRTPSAVDRTEMKICTRVSEWWNKVSHTENFARMQRIILSVLSSSDHISDVILVMVWFTTDIPVIIPLIGLFFISLTSTAPIFMFDEWYVKLAMPLGFGIFFDNTFAFHLLE